MKPWDRVRGRREEEEEEKGRRKRRALNAEASSGWIGDLDSATSVEQQPNQARAQTGSCADHVRQHHVTQAREGRR